MTDDKNLLKNIGPGDDNYGRDNVEPREEVKLHNTTDAMIWAKEFMWIIMQPGKLIDEEIMLGWFANAIMTGSDHTRWKFEKRITELEEQLSQKDRDETKKGNVKLAWRIMELVKAGDALVDKNYEHYCDAEIAVWQKAKEGKYE